MSLVNSPCDISLLALVCSIFFNFTQHWNEYGTYPHISANQPSFFVNKECKYYKRHNHQKTKDCSKFTDFLFNFVSLESPFYQNSNNQRCDENRQCSHYRKIRNFRTGTIVFFETLFLVQNGVGINEEKKWHQGDSGSCSN